MEYIKLTADHLSSIHLVTGEHARIINSVAEKHGITPNEALHYLIDFGIEISESITALDFTLDDFREYLKAFPEAVGLMKSISEANRNLE